MARPHSLPPKSHHQSRLTVEATDNQGHARITANASVVRTHDKTCAAPAASKAKGNCEVLLKCRGDVGSWPDPDTPGVGWEGGLLE